MRRALVCGFAALLALCAPQTPTHAAVEGAPVVIGGRADAGQRVLATMSALVLQAVGSPVVLAEPLTTAELRHALRQDEIDVVWESTGTALVVFHRYREAPPDQEAYERVRALDAERGLVWLQPSGILAGHALGMRRSDVESRGIDSLSDVARVVHAGAGLALANTDEFFARQDGLKPLQTAYDFRFPRDRVRITTRDEALAMLMAGEVDVAEVTPIDGRIGVYDIMVLEDDRGFFPPYRLAPVVREAVLADRPEIADALQVLAGALDAEILQALTLQIHEGQPVDEVARAHLIESGLLARIARE